MKSDKFQLISLNINNLSYQNILNKIIDFSKNRQSSYVCLANVHMTIEAYLDADFASKVNNADVVAADGMALVKSIKFLFGLKHERATGFDLLPDLLKKAASLDLSVFVFGGTVEMLSLTKNHISSQYPGITNHYYYSPPFRSLTNDEEIEIINTINQSGAQLVFVVLGCPKQEKWMAKMKGKINACMIGVGGALPVVIGMQKRAPQWMQEMSLEWLFRLFQEPKRLFRRYFITNSLFICLLLLNFLRSRIRSVHSSS
ncbi:MAG: WecB/TagA/CpsF family glycosyltransferase [Bacteroidetes bacterium]|nr:WecB/TagA/CpsF family glycosyltransferase [Bacteroidota bacterium]